MPPRSKTNKRKRSPPPPIELSNEQEQQLQNAFQVFDKNKSGIIGVKNCRQAIQSLGLNVEKETVQSLANDDDAIDFDTFRNLAGPKVVHRDKALHAFSLFDKDGKGVICYEDLQRVALELGESLSERELLEMLDDADTEGDGLLSKEDFLSVTENMNLNV